MNTFYAKKMWGSPFILKSYRKCRFWAKSSRINMEAYGIFMGNENIISNLKISAIGIFLIFSVKLGK